MNDNQNLKEIDHLKTYLEDYLATTNYYNPNREKKIICRNPSHCEHRPSMSLNKKNYTLHCFSCNATYSIIDLVIMDYELGDQAQPLEDRLKDRETVSKACQKIKDIFSISGEAPSKKDYKPIPKPNYNLEEISARGVLGNPLIEYLGSRGIKDRALIERLELKNYYGKEGDLKGYMTIPYQIGGEPLRTISQRVISLRRELGDLKDLPKEERYKHFGAMTCYDPFNYLSSPKERLIFVTEGEIDAISIYQALSSLHHENKLSNTLNIGAISIGGINNTKDLLQRLKEIDTSSLYLVSVLDNDERGKQGTRDLENSIRNLFEDGRAINFINGALLQFFSGKDINEALIENPKALESMILTLSSNYKEQALFCKNKYNEAIEEERKSEAEAFINSESLYNYLGTFKEHLENPIRPIQTYFDKLDRILRGGLREGLISIGGVSSLGKTSFILQLAEQIAQSRQQDILYYSLEMAIDELIAKGLSRTMYLKCNNYTERVKSHSEILNRGLWKAEELALYNESLDYYKSYSKHFYIKEGVYNLGVEDIRNQALRHCNRMGKAPLIVIDYLQILASPKDKRGLTDKQKTDENILLLKQLSRDLHTPIIVVSSLNRASYSLDVSLESFKESGAIEYTSDIILGLNYRLTDQERRTLNEDIQAIKKETTLENEREKLINDRLKEIRSQTPRHIKLDILKNRSGEFNKSIDMLFYPQFNYFMEDGASVQTHRDLLEHSKEHEGDNEKYISLPF